MVEGGGALGCDSESTSGRVLNYGTEVNIDGA